MSSTAVDSHTGKHLSKRERNKLAQRKRKIRSALTWSGVGLAVIAVLAFAFFTNPGQREKGGTTGEAAGGGAYPFQVGSPGPGEQAPDFTLPSTDGSSFTLSERAEKASCSSSRRASAASRAGTT